MAEKKDNSPSTEDLLKAAMDRIALLEAKLEGRPSKQPALKVPDGAEVFYITAPHFLQQVGDSAPKYVPASPEQPVKVVLPAKVRRKDANGQFYDAPQPESRHKKRMKPAKPVDSVKGKQPNETPPASAAVKSGSKRAADR